MSEEGIDRRLTTILSADVVGYSRLMGEDEVGTLASLKAHRRELIEPKTAEYYGRAARACHGARRAVLLGFGRCRSMKPDSAKALRGSVPVAVSDYPNRPLVGVGAVVVKGTRVLLVRRARGAGPCPAAASASARRCARPRRARCARRPASRSR